MKRSFTKYPSSYVKASTGSSSWFRTDDYQICKNLGNGEYQFIEFTGMDNKMISSYGTVNVNDYKDANGNWDEEALDIISTYYSDLDELRASVPNSSDEDQIVAECIFEQTSSFDSDSVALSEDEAYAYLDDIISGKIEASTSIKADTDPTFEDTIHQFIEKLKSDRLVKKNIYPYTWTSGSSTMVYPITVSQSDIELQWASDREPKAFLDKWEQIGKDMGILDYAYFWKSDGSCPSHITFKLNSNRY